ncbi:DUF58 domain-containing protein, partial [Nostoc sp. FACHB-110]|nr:DUF58 domain-containing protein [Nostoc sp. FACHB-110]
MIPSQRLYLFLISGIAIAPILSLFLTIPVSIAITLLFDAIILILMMVDGLRVRSLRVQIKRELPQRLSIGRDNPVILTVTAANTDAIIQIRDYYPTEFGVSTPTFTATISANT